MGFYASQYVHIKTPHDTDQKKRWWNGDHHSVPEHNDSSLCDEFDDFTMFSSCDSNLTDRIKRHIWTQGVNQWVAVCWESLEAPPSTDWGTSDSTRTMLHHQADSAGRAAGPPILDSRLVDGLGLVTVCPAAELRIVRNTGTPQGSVFCPFFFTLDTSSATGQNSATCRNSRKTRP